MMPSARFLAPVLVGLTLLCVQCKSQTKQEAYFLNIWAVKVDGDSQVADSIATNCGFQNIGMIKNLNVYKFVWLDGPERSSAATEEKTAQLLQDGRVMMAEQQVEKRRVKRSGYVPPTDPHWVNQWYLKNTGQTSLAIEGYDVNVEPAWLQGYTGCNSVVGIVDDGVQFSHPDLEDNVVVELGYDYVEDDPDPSPSTSFQDHGTRVAGVVAMGKGNDNCGVGVAYQSSLSAIRLLSSFGMTDIQESMALSHESESIRIYCNSWGPSDSGVVVEGPGSLLQAVFADSTQRAQGKGSIFVWAAGNGGEGDNCAADGYVCSIYTIGIGAATSRGEQVGFDENCSCKMATTFVVDGTGLNVTATHLHGLCIDSFSGTSAAAPIASGIIALALEANPSLSWRDVQYLIAYTSNLDLLPGGDWAINGAGLPVSHRHGFGAMDAEAMVTRARHWSSVPEQQSVVISPSLPGNFASTDESVKVYFTYNGTDIQTLEHVVVTVTAESFGRRGGMEFSLLSPSGTISQLLGQRSNDDLPGQYSNWPLMSVHFWGEDPRGEWLLTFRYQNSSSVAFLSRVNVTIYGVAEIPESVRRIPSECDPVCKRGCAAAGPEFCDACKTLRDARTLECIEDCPPGFTVLNGYCYNASLPQKQCTRNISTPEGSCRDAGYNDCCANGECPGLPPICFCDKDCYVRQDCCPDIAAVCSRDCRSDEFTCEGGLCIPSVWVCDGYLDCFLEDDENCTTIIGCDSSEFACESGQCIPVEWICDGDLDCLGGDDERNCTDGCDSSEFACESGACIPVDWMCDGTLDCLGGDDERNCTNGVPTTSSPVPTPAPTPSLDASAVISSATATPSPTQRPTLDSCTAAGFTSCCERQCELSSGCFCDVACYEQEDCCDDIIDICVPDVTIGFVENVHTFENDGKVDVHIGVLSGNLVGEVVIALTTSPGTAFPYEDYIPRDTLLRFSRGTSMITEEITIVNDLMYEGNETLEVSISLNYSSIVSVIVLPDSATVTILDTDPFCIDGTIRVSPDAGAAPGVYGGSLEICINETWRGICADSWSNTDASVACAQLGFSQYGAISEVSGYFAQPPIGEDEYLSVDCIGTELALRECPTQSGCSTTITAGVICQDFSIRGDCTDGEVRLINNGSSPREGRVELCVNNAWGTVCDDMWDSTDATVVCQQLGFSPTGALALANAHFGVGSGPIFLDELSCSGNEGSLLECNGSNPLGLHDCTHDEDASVICQVKVEEDVTIGFDPTIYTVSEEAGRVAVTIAVLSGRIREPVEVTIFSQDGSAIGYSDYQPPSATLRFNESTDNYRISVLINDDTTPELDEFFSLGLATEHADIILTPDTALVVILYSEISTPPDCVSGSVRLQGNVTDVEGTVEICVDGEWNMICGDEFDYTDAVVACKQLRLPSFGATAIFQDGSAQGPVLTNVDCKGSEPALLLCTSSESGDPECTFERSAGVLCFGGVTDCTCSRSIDCSVQGVYTGSNLVNITGNALKCSINFDRDLLERARDVTFIDDTFDENFLSAGSFLFLEQLDVVSRPANDINTCEVNQQVVTHGNPGIVLQSLGIKDIDIVYLDDNGVYASFYLDAQMLQRVAIEENYSVGGKLGRENSCSFQHLLYSLTKIQSTISAVACTTGSEGDTTIVTFEVTC